MPRPLTRRTCTLLSTSLAALALGAPAVGFAHDSNGRAASETASLLAQERYYSTYGAPTPLPTRTTAIQSASSGGVAPLPFILTTVGALFAGLGTGLGVHRIQLRRRATRVAT